MSRYEIKELFILLIFSIINISISCLITFNFGIQNTIIYRSLTVTVGDITYESLLFMIFSFLEILIYHFKYETKY